MIERLINASLQFRIAVIAATLILIGAGAWAFANINVDAFPDLTPNQVQVITVASGLSPNEVENLVSYPMETSMMGLPRTRGVRSISKAGISVVTVSYDDDVDMYFARAQVQQRMQDAVGSLPDGLQPSLGPPATPMGEVFQYLLESDSLSLMELKNIQEYTIKPLLRTIPGVADVNSWGGMVQQFHVEADPSRLSGYGLTLKDLERALADNNGNFGAGYVETRGERFTIRGLGRLADAADIGNVVVTTRAGGTPIHVHDVAHVQPGPMPREGAVSRDGRGETLSGMIVMLKGANGKDVVGLVEERLKDVRRLLPAGVTIRPFYNQGEVVDRTSHTVFINLIEGAILVTIVLFVFLRNIRASLITASVIPLSVLFAFFVMERFDVSANLMSLGALDFGLIVDAAVVMVENFVRRLEGSGHLPAEGRRTLIRKAAAEVGRPIVFSVGIIIAVYLPIFSLQGLEGRMFMPMAFTVCVAILGSLLLALTYVPMSASFLMKHVSEKPSRWFEAVRRAYVAHLDWALRHRMIVVGGAALALGAALASVPFLGTEFMPKLDEGSMLIETRRLPSTSLGQGMAIAKEVEQTLMRFPEVQSIVTKMGRPELATETMGLYAGDVYVMFKPRDQWKTTPEDLIVKMDAALKQIPGIDYNFTAPMAMRLDEAISGVRTELGVKVFGDDLAVLERKAAEIRDVIRTVPGAADTSVDVSAGAMQVELALDRAALARYGLNVSDVRDAVQTGIGGTEATEIIDGRKRFPVVVRLAEAYRGTPEAIGQMLIATPSGGRVTLAQVAVVRVGEGPELINHENGERMVIVQSNVRGRDLGGFAADVQREVAKRVSLPEGYFVTYGGQFENQQRAMQRLRIIVPAVLLIIVGFLYSSFGNGRQALLVMLNVPFALVGGIAALWLRDLNLNLSASVGFIALFGVAVLNGVLLVAYINQLRDAGEPLDRAVRAGSETRLRSNLLTALVAAFGFIPMAISTSPGSEVQRPLATVVIGGLVTSTILTLVVLPVLYEWLEHRWPAWAAAVHHQVKRRRRGPARVAPDHGSGS
jgi:cobalt-zinc-cadmium resistance protein CzcA